MVNNVGSSIIQQASQDVRQAAQTLANDIMKYSEKGNRVELAPTLPELTESAMGLAGRLSTVINGVQGQMLENLDSDATQLLGITREWATLRDALNQRRAGQPLFTRLRLVFDDHQGIVLSRAIATGDRIVRNFYSVANDMQIALINERPPITVLRDDRVHIEALSTPTSFIVGPIWGYNQAWNYIAYAHEVGHHLYHNVDGLADELLVHVMFTLGTQTISHQELRLWGSWLEEIFADLFCLLRVGPAAIHAGQRVALWLGAIPQRSRQPGDRLTQILLTSRDLTHPIPYIRIKLGLATLGLLPVVDGVKALEQRWDNLAKSPTDTKLLTPDDPHLQDQNVAALLQTGQLVLQTILDTPLYALAKKTEDSSSPPRSIRDVFYNGYDGQAVEQIKNTLVAQVKNSDTARVGLPPKAEIPQLLAAAEFARDELVDESLQKLHDTVSQAIASIRET